jgi:hypothetical protein
MATHPGLIKIRAPKSNACKGVLMSLEIEQLFVGTGIKSES